MRSLLVEPKAFDAINKFLDRNREKFDEYIPYAKIWEEIRHFVLDFEKMNAGKQNKKAKVIFDKAMKDIKMPSHLKVLTNENVNGDSNPDQGPGKDAFDDLSHFLCDMLQTKVRRRAKPGEERSDEP